jgi:hypothetical protein
MVDEDVFEVWDALSIPGNIEESSSKIPLDSHYRLTARKTLVSLIWGELFGRRDAAHMTR